MSRNLIIAIMVIIVLVGGALIIFGAQTQGPSSQSTPVPTQQEAMQETIEEKETTNGAMMGEEVSVTIENFAFSPKSITVKKGTKVTWTNQDTVKHNAVADDGSFETELMGKGESQSVTFDKTGTFSYHCTPHPNMKATIIVE